MGWQDDSASDRTCDLSYQPEVDPQISHGRRRKPTPTYFHLAQINK